MLSRALDACFGLHFYETAFWPGVQMCSTEQLTEEAVGLLDEKLHYVITNSGWPSWGSHGSSTGLPGWRLEFGVDCLQDCARIDFHRCGGGDDILNTQWAALFHLLPKYQSLIKE